MKIAIHKGEGGFSLRWIEYCKKNNIQYKVVNCYDSDVIEQLKDCDALMWHFYHNIFKDMLVARKILFALEHAGVKVFPDFHTAWHFDDKVAQKYLLEAIKTPMVPTYVLYEKKRALDWVSTTTFPKVFKLRGGAGSSNVKLVKSEKQARKLIKRSFNRGFPLQDRFYGLKEAIRMFRQGPNLDKGIQILKVIFRLVFPKQKTQHLFTVQKGYVYFQEFVPNNSFDIRIIVIGDKAFAIKRMTRENDFRASGSGNIIFDKNQIDERCVQISFDVNNKLKCQSVAFDFVFDENNNPLIVEISYGFAMEAYDACPGYWDSSLQWHEGKFNPQEWMVEDLLFYLKSDTKNL